MLVWLGESFNFSLKFFTSQGIAFFVPEKSGWRAKRAVHNGSGGQQTVVIGFQFSNPGRRHRGG